MKRTIITLILLLFSYIQTIAQLYNSDPSLLVDPDDLGMNFDLVRVGRIPLKVPEGKIWFTKENRNITVEYSIETLRPGSKCNQYFKGFPKISFGFHAKPPFEKIQNWGMIYMNCKEFPSVGPNAYKFIPSSFVQDNFDFNLIKTMSPRMLGHPELTFYPGTEIYVDSCFESIHFYEINMPLEEYDLYKYNLASKQAEYDSIQKALERIRIKKFNDDLREKVKNKYNFSLEELINLPTYKLHPDNLAEIYKQIPYDELTVDFVINEDGAIELSYQNKQKVNKRLFDEFLRFSPGQVLIDSVPVNVRTRLTIDYQPDRVTNTTDKERIMKVARKRKPPIVRIKEYPDIYPEKLLKGLINFEKVLRNEKIGSVFFKISTFKIDVGINMYSNDQGKKLISLKKKADKIKFAYKRRDTDWKKVVL